MGGKKINTNLYITDDFFKHQITNTINQILGGYYHVDSLRKNTKFVVQCNRFNRKEIGEKLRNNIDRFLGLQGENTIFVSFGEWENPTILFLEKPTNKEKNNHVEKII